MKLKQINLLFAALIVFSLSACTVSGTRDIVDGYTAYYPSQVLVGDVYILNDGEMIDGVIVGFNTTLVIEEGARVSGDIILFGSQSEIAGKIIGDMNLFAVETHIKDSAVITGSINQIASEMNIDPGASISGDINTFATPDSDLNHDVEIPSQAADILRPRTWFIFQIFRSFLLTFFNLLIIFLFKDQVLKVTHQLKSQPLVSWTIGLLSFFAVPVVSIVFLITVCLSPIGIILLIALMLVNLLGWTVTSFFIGDQLTKWLKLDWGEGAVTAVGSVLFGIFFTLIALIPFASLIASSIISAFGNGAVLLLLIRRKTPIK